jgi:hypothetical protein
MTPRSLPGSISVLECETLSYLGFFTVLGVCKEECFEREKERNGGTKVKQGIKTRWPSISMKLILHKYY